MASIPTNTARTAPLDTSVKLGAAQQRALNDLVAMGFGKQACKEALLKTGTTSMDRLLAALTGPEETPVKKRDAAGTPLDEDAHAQVKRIQLPERKEGRRRLAQIPRALELFRREDPPSDGRVEDEPHIFK